MGKMQEAQKQMEESKKKLDSMFVEGIAEGGLVKVTATGNKKITNIAIDESLLTDKEAIEDLLIVAVNKAIEEADKVFETEMGSVAQGMIPPGMGF